MHYHVKIPSSSKAILGSGLSHSTFLDVNEKAASNLTAENFVPTDHSDLAGSIQQLVQPPSYHGLHALLQTGPPNRL